VKTYQPCPMFRPDFLMDVDEAAQTIRFRSDATGFEATFNAATHKLESWKRQASPLLIQPAFELEGKFVRKGTPVSVLMSGDKHDTTPAAGTTGGGRRNFIAVGFERAFLGYGDGTDALFDWAVDQGQRPKAWLPFTGWKYDGYFGTLNGWKCDKQDATGWSIFRADHLESAQLFAGAAIGEDMALAQFTLLACWVTRTFWNAGAAKLQQGWHGSRQPRAMGWMLWFFGRAVMLGFDSAPADFVADFLGCTPKIVLRALIDDLNARPPRLGENKADDRAMVDFRDGSGEIRSDYPWQWSILFAACGWLKHAGILSTSGRFERLLALLDGVADDLWSRAIGPGGVAYAVSSSTAFTQADVDRANTMETDKSHHYELVDGVIRDTPRTSDAELTAGAIGLFKGVDDPRFTALLSVLPPPSNMAKYDDLARYLDPALALKEAAALAT
jgi:hypothetical protein